jgi:heme exporter protein A
LSTDSSARLAVHDLALSRGGRQLFAGLDLEVAAGQLALVTGANGTGKTTLLRTLAGLSEPASGSITLDGIATHRIATGLTAPIAFQGHADGLKRDLTVEENLRFYAAVWGGDAIEAAIIAELELAACLDRPVRYLSAGQRRRAALGCLRMRPATFWLLDEPLTNLDARGSELVERWLAEHIGRGGSSVVATHRPEALINIASVVVEL